MLFCTSEFVVFILLILLLHHLIPHRRSRHVLLLAASYGFYMSWNVRYGWLLLAVTLINYAAGLAMARQETVRGRKWCVAAAVGGSLGILGFFKYANFVAGSVTAGSRLLGITMPQSRIDIVLPVGISFFTFQALSYTIDVYRGKLPTHKSLVEFGLFVSFFPQLVAGPIVRAVHFLPQLVSLKRWDWGRIRLGIQFLVVGAAKKVLIADTLARVVDPVYAQPSSYGFADHWVALICYAMQIYYDFAGYSDMAIGAAHLFGYDLCRNFDTPYFSRSPAEFWQRWHISLSTWLRDYLYIPLGGNRFGRLATLRNLMITMFLGGLWHGAHWRFVLWGFYHGILLVVWRVVEHVLSIVPWAKNRSRRPGTQLACWGLTFICVVLGWVLFRAENLHSALIIYGKLFQPASFDWHGLVAARPELVVLVLVALEHLAAALARCDRWSRFSVPVAAEAAFYAVTLVVTVVASYPGGRPFIYFQF